MAILNFKIDNSKKIVYIYKEIFLKSNNMIRMI
jgi:hypothetical protein